MIQSFGDKSTENLHNGWDTKEFRAIEEVARRKLRSLDSAKILQDLKSPPGNRLESLKGDRKGTYSIRINDQWRICFLWKDNGPHEVQIVDYH
ncbi:type II toxin-antitoxin system RelE/ParE family toxin [Leptospira sp. FAT2]|uniref:type II toxin-antitoxin system RelE/ParE family toxin n=1 Tax=Leptospira sanjuanensis TaxID=2879643 RepID=UPI001EE7DCC0|nr:type II toxin-antitoxin system RelE/ParE family toxin [Leptospira sanjuanensis]MCG6168535.1 type II toxin-antitoxin system RelE/ParE family toxin [Leptospira sanjuanensis]MCG6193953.1 type II toxin-antitoxin system RelE/ParE family toxin [Leptospira sanjuanensis]